MRGKLKEQVEYCLKHHPETRNSDIELTLAIWREYYPEKVHRSLKGVEVIKTKDLFTLPREDNVKRYRAKFNEAGEYLPTNEEILKRRGLKAKEWRQDMRDFSTVDKTELCPHGYPLWVACPECVKKLKD